MIRASTVSHRGPGSTKLGEWDSGVGVKVGASGFSAGSIASPAHACVSATTTGREFRVDRWLTEIRITPRITYMFF